MDPVKELFAELSSPDPSIRFSVLSRIEEITLTDSQIAEFRNLLASECEPGIRFHMQKVLARFETAEQARPDCSGIFELLQQPAKDEISLALYLESVKRGEAQAVADELRKSGWVKFSAQLLPSVLKFLKKFGAAGDVDAVATLCSHSDPRVLSAAIEALEKLSPERLREHIVPLLLNTNSGIRSRAVRILYRFDPSEALRHFESMLFSNSEEEKQAALFHSFFFPFKQIESLMLRYISVETDSELIKKAGLVFMANPDRQIPLRLLEARQACVGEKYQLIDTILKGVLQSLFQAGLVNAEPDQMLEVIESHFREKRIRLYIERFGLGLKSGDADTRLKSALKLCELLRHGVDEPRPLIDDFLKKESDEKIIARVRQFLESGRLEPETTRKIESESVGRTEQPLQQKAFIELLPEQRQKVYDAINRENYGQQMAGIVGFFSQLPVEEQITVLGVIERAGTRKETELILRCIESDNADLLTAAIDALSVVNPEALHPLLPQLIKHRFDEVKVAAIKVFALFDKKQAISLVEQMLHSIRPVQRRNAIFCLAHFDYASVSQILLAALKNEGDEENQQQIFSILLSNADEETFFQVYVEARSGRSARAELYTRLYAGLVPGIIANDPAKTEGALFAAAEERLEEEKRSQNQRSAYQLEKIQKIRQESQKKIEPDPGLLRFAVVAYASGAVLTALIWFLFMAPSAQPQKAPGPPVKGPVQPKSITKTVKGVVSGVNVAQRQIEIADPAGQKTYRVHFPEKSGALPAVGNTFHGQLKITGERGGISTGELLTAF